VHLRLRAGRERARALGEAEEDVARTTPYASASAAA
jgi:hypothetical protein